MSDLNIQCGISKNKSNISIIFFFNDTATTEIYTLSLHERSSDLNERQLEGLDAAKQAVRIGHAVGSRKRELIEKACEDRKSTRLNSSHGYISYAVFCLKKKKR